MGLCSPVCHQTPASRTSSYQTNKTALPTRPPNSENQQDSGARYGRRTREHGGGNPNGAHARVRVRVYVRGRLRVLPALRGRPGCGRARTGRECHPARRDRRQVTVLFADVSGFTTLAERLDPEEVRAFQNALFETLAQAIARYDGFVEKFVGDAVMAVFGAPVAHEDDPERALNTALDMLARSARLSDRWASRLGQPVTLHIGVHTGPVVAGSLGHAAGSAYAVTGDTVNTTARLLAAAPGTILVSDATHALTRHRFAFDPPRELTLRGKSDPVVVHRLLGALAEPRSARGLAAHGLAAPLVGRAAELAARIRARFSARSRCSTAGRALPMRWR
jgi:adenylate cyclase